MKDKAAKVSAPFLVAAGVFGGAVALAAFVVAYCIYRSLKPFLFYKSASAS